jgi:hypothetical protein
MRQKHAAAVSSERARHRRIMVALGISEPFQPLVPSHPCARIRLARDVRRGANHRAAQAAMISIALDEDVVNDFYHCVCIWRVIRAHTTSWLRINGRGR